MKLSNYKKIAEKLKKKDAVMANQCTCSNCNCRSANNMVNLSKLYKEKLSNCKCQHQNVLKWPSKM